MFYVDEEPREKRLCLIGVTGSGKSTLGNVLLGLDPDPSSPSRTDDLASVFGFATGSDASSVTQKVESLRGFWRGDVSRQIKVVDTPGHGDSHGNDEVHRQNFVAGMADEKEIDAFIWVKNAQQPRYDSLHQEFFSLFVAMFGPAFYRNLVVVFTHWGFGEKDVRKRRGKTLEETKNQLWASVCEGHGALNFVAGGNPIPMVAIDALHDPTDPQESEAFESQLEDLWKIVNNFSSLPVMDVQMVRDKKAQLEAQLECLQVAHEEERVQLAKEREELEAALKEAEDSEALLISMEEHSRKMQEIVLEKRVLAEKIRYLEEASSPPWWLALLLNVGQLLASVGLNQLANSSFFQNLQASQAIRAGVGVVGQVTSTVAQELLKKYVDPNGIQNGQAYPGPGHTIGEDHGLKAACQFLGVGPDATPEEVDSRFDVLEEELAVVGKEEKMNELILAFAKIKACLGRKKRVSQ